MYKEKQSREWNGGREVSSPYPFPRLNLIVRVSSEKNITLSGEIIPCNAKYQRFFKKEREREKSLLLNLQRQGGKKQRDPYYTNLRFEGSIRSSKEGIKIL